jgi:putative peptidoglycan lipid II flippase
VLIGGITVAARLIGFGRQLVFAHTVRAGCLGSAYTTANQIPNIIYDIVLGGALASIMVPVLAGPAARAARDPVAAADTSRIASALLTWTCLILIPVSAAVALAAHPAVSFLIHDLPGCSRATAVAVGARMLAVFAPQILLYGLAVALYGTLQAHRAFTAPALAPVISSLVVIGAYLLFVPLSHGNPRLAGLPEPAELTLSVGTTAGVAALVATAAVRAWRLRLRIRPALRFPPGAAARARRLAAAGIAALLAQDLALIVVIRLANGHGGRGAVVLYSYGWQVFLVPYAALAIPIATSAFPMLSARAANGENFEAAAASAVRAVLIVSWLGAALLAATAVPVARLFAPGTVRTRELAWALAAFAPGLAGYGLSACASRVLLAADRNRVVAAWLSAGWLVVLAADLALVLTAPARWVVPALALGNTIGLSVAGAALLAAVRWVRGPASTVGAPRAAIAGLAAALAGAGTGAGVAKWFPVSGFIPNAVLGTAVAAAALVVFGAVAAAFDAGDVRAVLTRLARIGGR